jgi:hypothetical protein
MASKARLGEVRLAGNGSQVRFSQPLSLKHSGRVRRLVVVTRCRPGLRPAFDLAGADPDGGAPLLSPDPGAGKQSARSDGQSPASRPSCSDPCRRRPGHQALRRGPGRSRRPHRRRACAMTEAAGAEGAPRELYRAYLAQSEVFVRRPPAIPSRTRASSSGAARRGSMRLVVRQDRRNFIRHVVGYCKINRNHCRSGQTDPCFPAERNTLSAGL